MTTMSRTDATSLATKHHIPLSEDFHTLPASTVDRITSAADEMKYRKPRNANGSRARYFYAYLRRCLGKDQDAADAATIK
jgi:hypothetical protein